MTMTSEPTAPDGSTPALSEAERQRGVVLVTLATFALWLSLYFYVPVLPLRALELGTPDEPGLVA